MGFERKNHRKDIKKAVTFDYNCLIFSGATRNRTGDTRIFSPLLYQLSYGTLFRLTGAKIRTFLNLAIDNAIFFLIFYFAKSINSLITIMVGTDTDFVLHVLRQTESTLCNDVERITLDLPEVMRKICLPNASV